MKYVGTYRDPKDIVTKDKLEAVASRVSTNEDNIAMAESDIDGLQTTVGTLQTNVNNVQTALNSKQDTVVGGASTITENNLTASRALISNSSGKVAVSTVTSTELGYLDGVTSNIQTQLNKKLETAPVTSVNGKTGAVQLNAADVSALPNTTVIPSKTSQLTNDSGFITDKELADKVSKSGDTMTGKLTVPQVETGDGNSNLLQCRKFRGEGNADTYYHAIDFGYKNHDRVDFYEYGGIWNFYKNQTGKVNGGVLCGRITSNGWEGRAILKNNSTSDTTPLTENSNVIATTAFVHGLVDNVKYYSANNPPPYPVTSVNGQTGAVTLSKGDVGLGNVDNVKQYSASNPPPYPVTSVNGKTGAVTVNVPTVPSTTNILKGNGSGGVVAATRGSDYIASGNITKQTLVASESTPAENYAINWVYG